MSSSEHLFPLKMILTIRFLFLQLLYIFIFSLCFSFGCLFVSFNNTIIIRAIRITVCGSYYCLKILKQFSKQNKVILPRYMPSTIVFLKYFLKGSIIQDVAKRINWNYQRGIILQKKNLSYIRNLFSDHLSQIQREIYFKNPRSLTFFFI